MSLRSTVEYYTNLLLAQYRRAGRARKTIDIYVKQALGDMLVEQLQAGFDVDTAVGAQLDTIGKYVGVPRNIGLPVDRPYYDFSDYDGTVRNNGFTDYTNPAQNAQAIWYQYQFSGTENTALSDTAYRSILKLKIILNANDGTLASIMALLWMFFEGVVSLVDNKDMTITYTLSQRLPLAPEVMRAFLPKPMGVGVNFVVLEATASPLTLTKTLTTSAGSGTVTSDPCTATPIGGTFSYNYLWERVSGSTDVYIDTPFNPDTRFAALLLNPSTRSAVFRCTVTDYLGLVAYTQNVSVVLTIQTPP